MTNSAVVVIQCRYDSRRLPGKILKKIKSGLTCLEFIVQRLNKAKYNCIVATTDRDIDLPIVREVNEMIDTGRYKYLIGAYMGDYENIMNRLYNASDGYEYFIRITGDDILVDMDILNEMAEQAMNDGYDYMYPYDLIRGCDCDIFKRSAVKEAMKLYKTDKVSSIEFLFRNDKFKSGRFEVPETYKQEIRLSMDTDDDWKLIEVIFNKLHSMNQNFTTWDIVELFSRNEFMKDINKRPLVSVYMVYKDYPIKWMAEAIASIREQEFSDYEFILLDYGSKKLHVMMPYVNDERIRTYGLRNLTFIEAINYAIGKAEGKYVLRLDADDKLKPDAIQKMVSYIKEHDFYSAVAPWHDVINERGDVVEKNREVDKSGLILPTVALIEKNKYKYVSFIEKQEYRDGVNLIESFRKYDFMIGVIKESLFYYRIHGKSITHGQYKQEEINEYDSKIKKTFESGVNGVV